MRKQGYTEQERKRCYYFFDYLFWLGEITWENYHKVNFKQPRGSDMLWACIVLFIFIPLLAIAGLFLHDLAYEVFGKYPLIPTLWMIFEDSTFAFRSGDKHRSRRIYGK